MCVYVILIRITNKGDFSLFFVRLHRFRFHVKRMQTGKRAKKTRTNNRTTVVRQTCSSVAQPTEIKATIVSIERLTTFFPGSAQSDSNTETSTLDGVTNRRLFVFLSTFRQLRLVRSWNVAAFCFFVCRSSLSLTFHR